MNKDPHSPSSKPPPTNFRWVLAHTFMPHANSFCPIEIAPLVWETLQSLFFLVSAGQGGHIFVQLWSLRSKKEIHVQVKVLTKEYRAEKLFPDNLHPSFFDRMHMPACANMDHFNSIISQIICFPAWSFKLDFMLIDVPQKQKKSVVQKRDRP